MTGKRGITSPLRTAIAVVVLALAAGATPAAAGDDIAPDVPEARKGEHCVKPVPYMRRNHMDMLKHKRDKTMHKGQRKKKYSLKRCMDCHAVKGDDGDFVTAKSDKHFCNVCHDTAAVNPDCFSCHASTPGGELKVQSKEASR